MEPAAEKKVNVIYIMGNGRSGSTVLDRVLGTFPGVTSFGEMFAIFLRGYRENWVCACGADFKDCEFWQRVMPKVLDDDQQADRMIRYKLKFDRIGMFWKLRQDSFSPSERDELNEYVTVLDRLYRALAEETGCDTIIDSSKPPSRALILSRVPSVSLSLIHLIRDPRAVMYSCQKTVFDSGRRDQMPRSSLVRTQARWVAAQMAASSIAKRYPYVRVRYEDFATNPQKELERIAATLPPLQGKPVMIGGDNEIEAKAYHAVAGNPMRFQRGPLRIRLDEAWKQAPNAKLIKLVSWATHPIARHFGYSMF